MAVKFHTSSYYSGVGKLEIERMSNGTMFIWLFSDDGSACEHISVNGVNDRGQPIKLRINDHLAEPESTVAELNKLIAQPY